MKKLISAVLSAAICLSASALPMATAADVSFPESPTLKTKDYGDDFCGKQAHWKLEGGTLTVYGSGNMTDWEKANLSPWYERMGEIRSVVIEEGITSVGRACFMDAPSITSVKLPSTITTINMSAFQGTSIQNIDIPAACTTIGDKAFSNCSGLKDIIIRNGNCKIVTPAAFYNVNGTFHAPSGGTVEKFASTNGKSFQPLGNEPPQTQPTETTTTTTTTTTSTTTTTTTVQQGNVKIETYETEGFLRYAPAKYEGQYAYLIESVGFTVSASYIKNVEFEMTFEDPSIVLFEKYLNSTTAAGQYRVIPTGKVVIPDSVAGGTYYGTLKITKATDANGNDITKELPWTEHRFQYQVNPNRPKNGTVTTTGTTGTTTSSTTTTTTTVTTPVGDAKLGDANLDNIIDGRDATAILTEYAKSSAGGTAPFSGNARAAAVSDVNGDKIIDGRDATAVCTYYAYISVDGNPMVDLKTWLNNK